MKTKRPRTFWWHVRITGSLNTEKLSPVLFALRATGLVEEPSALSAYFEGPAFDSGDEIQSVLSDRLDPSLAVAITRIPVEDWDTAWKKNFKPIRASRRIVVRPSWETYRRKKNDIVVIIDPKMSFGTGTHESTRLALQLSEKYVARGMRVLDIGTGTGILAIAAAKLGARRVYACDVEEPSIHNARENFRRNRCREKMSLKLGSLAHLPKTWPATYSVILANIQRTVIVDLLPAICARLAPGGMLITAGLLKEETETMRRAFQTHGLLEKTMRTDGEWAAFALQRP